MRNRNERTIAGVPYPLMALFVLASIRRQQAQRRRRQQAKQPKRWWTKSWSTSCSSDGPNVQEVRRGGRLPGGWFVTIRPFLVPRGNAMRASRSEQVPPTPT